MIDLGLLYQFITNNILSLAVVIYKTAVDLELVYKFITNRTYALERAKISYPLKYKYK